METIDREDVGLEGCRWTGRDTKGEMGRLEKDWEERKN